MADRTYSYGRHLVEEEDIEAVVNTLRGDWLTQGPAVRAFEAQLSARLGAPYCSATSSGTAGLHLTALGLGWKPGDIIITTPMTFLATPNCILYAGATPDFADIDPQTYTLDPGKVEERVRHHVSNGRKVKAVIGVDYAGNPCDWESLARVARTYDLQLVNDHCHALGSAFKGDPLFAAKYADAVVLSFHPVKHVTTGEGGAVLTRHSWLNEKVKSCRSHGITRDPGALSKNDGPWYYEMIELGFNYRITDIQCALGMSQLARLDTVLKTRRSIASFYDTAFGGDDRFILPSARKDDLHAFHLYPLQVRFAELGLRRSVMFDRLKEQGIRGQVHYIPVHLQPYYRERFGFCPGDYPAAEQFYERELSIPIHPKLRTDDLEYISSAVKASISD